VRGVSFQTDSQGHVEKLQNRWELFVILDAKKKDVVASCLVQFNDIYATCEIHEVCVATQGKGYCKQLIGQVRRFIERGGSGTVREMRIFCERGNVAACKCYAGLFADAHVITTQHTLGYVTTFRTFD
jgi:hypothetical protein